MPRCCHDWPASVPICACVLLDRKGLGSLAGGGASRRVLATLRSPGVGLSTGVIALCLNLLCTEVLSCLQPES